MQPKRRRRFVATTDSDHDNPIFPDLARDRIVDGPNQLWVADITLDQLAGAPGCSSGCARAKASIVESELAIRVKFENGAVSTEENLAGSRGRCRRA